MTGKAIAIAAVSIPAQMRFRNSPLLPGISRRVLNIFKSAWKNVDSPCPDKSEHIRIIILPPFLVVF